jgi:hypothetical protein
MCFGVRKFSFAFNKLEEIGRGLFKVQYWRSLGKNEEIQDGRNPGRDLNQVLSEYKPRYLLTEQSARYILWNIRIYLFSPV